VSTSDYLQIDISAVAGTTVVSSTSFQADVSNYSTFDAASETVNVGQIAGETVTTDAADNWDNFWYNNDIVSTERVSNLPTTGDLFTTASQIDVGRIAGELVTTDAADNWDNFWYNNDVVSTERVGDSVTTDDLLTTGDIMEANVVAVSSASLTSKAGDNFSTWFDNAGVAVGKDIGDVSTFTTAKEVDIGAVKGSAITDINDFAATGHVVDGARTLGDVYKGMAVNLWGNSTYDGTTVVYYDAGGSSYWEAALASGYRTVTTV
jgi:hypothetical protein